MPDANLRDIGAAAVAGIECGNGVLIDHSDGWTCQYCHMKRDSVEVRVGQAVDAGDRLGQIGMSGAAEFPHVHLSIRQDEVPVDPFAGPGAPHPCAPACQPLWSNTALAQLAYTASGPLNAGFTSAAPNAAEILDGEY